MADVEDAVRTRLTEHAGTAALIGTRSWFLMLPQDPTFPASVVQQISGRRESAMGADIGKAEGGIQVRACSNSRAGAHGLAEQQRAALQRFRGTVAGTELLDLFLMNEIKQFEEETKVWSVLQDFMVWWSE